jgi:hypothetical protein
MGGEEVNQGTPETWRVVSGLWIVVEGGRRVIRDAADLRR